MAALYKESFCSFGFNEVTGCCSMIFLSNIQCWWFYYVVLSGFTSMYLFAVTAKQLNEKYASFCLSNHLLSVLSENRKSSLRMTTVQPRMPDVRFSSSSNIRIFGFFDSNFFWKPNALLNPRLSRRVTKLSVPFLGSGVESPRDDIVLEQEDVLQRIQKDIDTIKSSVPEDFVQMFKEFVVSYVKEINAIGSLHPQEVAATVRNFIGLIKKNRKFPFAPFHREIRHPIDYARIGNEFWKPLVDFSRSKFPSKEKLVFLLENLKLGKNILLLSNHQTEPDPQLMRLMFEHVGVPELSGLLIMVAGSRVRTDPLAIPFSMGCNLLSVHSKKHLDNPPSLRTQKIRENLLTIRSLQELFQEGGKLIWVAPSGGRDRPSNESEECVVAPFDNKTIELYCRMAEKSSHQTLFVPMALYSSPICPPPKHVKAELGETRTCRRSGVGMAIGEPMVSESKDKSQNAEILTVNAEEKTKEMYTELQKAIKLLASPNSL